MPSQPPDNYERQFDFTDFSQTQPTKQQPGDKIDLELNELQQSVNDTISRLNEIQRDDGKLRDDIFDFTPMNNAVIEAQAARDDSVAAKVEAVAAKDYIVGVADGLTDSVHADAEAAAQAASTAIAVNSQAQVAAAYANQKANIAGTYAADAQNAASAANLSKIDAQSARNQAQASASSANSDAQAAAISAVDAENSAVAAAASAASITGVTYALPLSKTGSEVSIDLSGVTTSIGEKLTNSINWTGEYDNGVTYQAGDGVIFGGEYFVLKAYIGAAGYDPAAYASSWTKLIPSGVGGNPFDQSLNIGDAPSFGSLTLTDASVNLTLSGAIQFVDSTQQSTAFPPAGGTSAQYIAGDGTLITFPTLATANKLTATVSNQTGSVLTKGQVVYINGTHGNLPTVALAQANAESTSAGTYGFVTADIGNNSTGTIVIAGIVENLATNLLADGDKIYLSPTVAGGYTTTKPYAPNHMVYLGVVTRAHPSLGTIQLRIQNGFELDELHDVQAQAPNDGDSIFFDSSDSQWKTAQPVSKIPSATTAVAGKVELATDAEAIAGTSTTLAVTPASGKAATDGIVDAQRVDIQTFGSPTTSGTFTWTKPEGAKMVMVRMTGGGAGGGGGACDITANARSGAGGGGGAGLALFFVPASELGSTVSVVVGAGGAGGAGRSTAGTQSAGSNGGSSYFGNYRCLGGYPPVAGSATGGTGYAGSLFNLGATAAAGAGANGSTTTGLAGGGTNSGYFVPCGGGGGAGLLGGVTTNSNGGAGGSRTVTSVPLCYNVALAGGSGGIGITSTPATSGTNQDVAFASGTGGGGGYCRSGFAGGNGGNGGWPGGGGGGGGASDVGFLSGAGGTGGNGIVIVTTYF